MATDFTRTDRVPTAALQTMVKATGERLIDELEELERFLGGDGELDRRELRDKVSELLTLATSVVDVVELLEVD